jgi:phospholipid-binding lipoprotein MlaA
MVNRFWRNKNTGLLFYALMLNCAFILLTVNVSYSNTLSAQENAGNKGNTLPQFVYDVDGTLLAQSSEITILLEKQLPPSNDKIDVEPKVPEKEKKENLPQGAGASMEGVGSGKITGEVGQTVSALETAPSVEFYEELEDPFGPAEGEEIPVLTDPFVGYNRWMFNVNEGLYDYVMEPIAKGWRFVIPEDLRIVIRNAFDNALSPVKLVSSLAQGDFNKSGRVLSRVLINTTAGLGGMLDVAGQEYNIENVNEDFDQALGHYDVPTGPYLVLPFFGPSTARNVAGRVVDSFLSPSIFFAPSFFVSAGITVGETTNDVSFIIDDKKALEESAIDEYESVRDFYHQYREGLVKE